jgi:Rrf2 family transcriptional regulator, nitric oxide-sensitive transcriptional repressor
MHLNAFTDYGLRVLMRLAGDPERSFATRELARSFAVSQHHLNKVVTSLSIAGYVKTKRGRGGGLRLAKPASDIRLGDVVRDLEQGVALVECFRADGGACTLTLNCRLITPLKAAQASFLQNLNQSTLADVAYRVGCEASPPSQAAQ